MRWTNPCIHANPTRGAVIPNFPQENEHCLDLCSEHQSNDLLHINTHSEGLPGLPWPRVDSGRALKQGDRVWPRRILSPFQKHKAVCQCPDSLINFTARRHITHRHCEYLKSREGENISELIIAPRETERKRERSHPHAHNTQMPKEERLRSL